MTECKNKEENKKRNLKAGADEYQLLGLSTDCSDDRLRGEDELEGFRSGCQSSMRSG